MNLSGTELSELQIKILNKGPKFTPTPRSNNYEPNADIEKFTRKLRLLEYFADKEGSEDDISLVRNKSHFYPERNRSRHLDMTVDYLNNMNLNLQGKGQKSNLSKEEWLAIKNLQNNEKIIMKEADKGGSVVIMKRDHYVKMVYEQLNDEKYYKRVDTKHDKVLTSL